MSQTSITGKLIQKDDAYKEAENKIRAVLDQRMHLRFLLEEVNTRLESTSSEKEPELYQKILNDKKALRVVQENLDELITTLCGTNESLLLRYAYFSRRYVVTITDENVEESQIADIIKELGADAVYSHTKSVTLSKDKLHKTTLLTFYLKTDAAKLALRSYCIKMCWVVSRYDTYQNNYYKQNYSTIYHNNQRNSPDITQETADFIMTDFYEKLLSLGYDSKTALRIIRVELVNSNYNQLYFNMFSPNLKKEADEIVTEINKQKYWVE
ncbi:hypothetical protein EIN_172480 [Entamoeba invadens IP1]|uniref:Uncharacterized protein n=1 Tax=Entamoeba invadens IP1 TaxID=370355 RepID=A0A0A1U130_ENTIV|nr:hypothetical protein EIN_172480 [Entamoeba invadens IP1]ELP84613.1 hypothetical protein EIN_172480 [Entamoeba invadens IP1]|eukprot:XP_004183959.1 hypothetical protein EIN_172480 [Entamoeba invadens IP1]